MPSSAIVTSTTTNTPQTEELESHPRHLQHLHHPHHRNYQQPRFRFRFESRLADASIMGLPRKRKHSQDSVAQSIGSHTIL
ncbi:GD24657 [Drosophila simulans]|uniref:GD24657 n=1 Tax=Drosophila simulans TaxID=7240 RepID=B4NTQ4_DROSI|nr:GD24657 [Drosophila simulans]